MSFTHDLFEDRVARIRRDSEIIEGDATVLAELNQLTPGYTPIRDIRRSAQSLRLAANKLDEIAQAAELIP